MNAVVIILKSGRSMEIPATTEAGATSFVGAIERAILDKQAYVKIAKSSIVILVSEIAAAYVTDEAGEGPVTSLFDAVFGKDRR